MAKENTVYLYGRVKQPPRIYKNKAGQYVLGKIVVDTNRKSYATEELLLRGEIRRDSILVRTEHEEMIRDVYTLINEGDFVQIKGTLCTKEYQREPLCMHCHEVMEPYIEDGVQVYVNPIAVNIMERGEVSFHEFVEQNKLDHDMQNMLLSTGFFALSERDIWQHLEKEIEFSNQIFLDGQLCREPVFQPGGEKGKPPSMIQFQIASNRKRRIVEDGVDKKTDYVWIKAYGLKAAEYAAALHIHSNVSINGAIQTRSYVKEYECPYCGQISKIAYLAVEVIPYSIEYGANCTLPDPQERGEESDETDEISGSFDSESD